MQVNCMIKLWDILFVKEKAMSVPMEANVGCKVCTVFTQLEANLDKSSPLIEAYIEEFLTLVDFNEKTNGPPKLCGWDLETGEDKFCCKDLDPSTPRVNMPQPPMFPEKGSNEARPCRDHSTECPKWAKNRPDSCKPHPDPLSNGSINHSYEFMREACMETCGRCENNVR